ncbi:MAG: bifunctional DNA-binding transcriptional regulator/O6-methylguanine-DNA methyltransferase Ada [Acidobacteria bacterium]|nr:bifunctional DNA-binding transcriptional regulator/O6-methylguanine-DNA methyltransferase Ada [Acidobacteriota bacterium]MBI3662094.1 bifunctional DNA-binding transcriptional regulator/O6-methylguanine-DNA methyltransferase Ada [Acidobacteriota bacterium]
MHNVKPVSLKRSRPVCSRLSLARCWRAVLAHDSSCDGAFVYAVRSTGIYCRPSCPSRRPRRRFTVFFAGPDAAERAGFRACRRCHPRGPVADPLAPRIGQLCRFIEARPNEKFTLRDLSARIGLNPYRLLRAFQSITGITPRQYAAACRLRAVKSGLRKEANVTFALYDAGYGSSSRLYEHAPALLGMTPATYQRGGLGMSIHYSTATCPLGRLLVAATSRGICMVSLGDSDSRLEAALKQEYPLAQIARDASALQPWLRAVLARVAGKTPSGQLPVDVQATAFQRRVWQELLAIPRGATRSYSEIARAVGRPRAVRAVAHACATNPAAVVIPCHRVMRSNGDLGGYRWGLDRKSALLRAEKASQEK